MFFYSEKQKIDATASLIIQYQQQQQKSTPCDVVMIRREKFFFRFLKKGKSNDFLLKTYMIFIDFISSESFQLKKNKTKS